MKMRTKWQFLVASMAALAIAGSAQAEMIAGWDFSQYASDGSLDTDGDFVGEGTLSANYSTVIGGDNAGAAANPYGTMYINGQKGSSTTDYEFGFPAEFAASAGDLVNNKTRPVLAGGISQFETCSASDGQAFCLPLKMRAIASVNVVFEATLAPDGLLGEDWMLSFGGRTESTSQNVSVEFSTDATNWTSFGSLLLTTTDALFQVDFSSFVGDLTQTAYVRLGFTGTELDATTIDHVAFEATVVPEPGTMAMLMTGLLGLASFRTRNRA